jgi:hypothetical protein
MNGVTLVTCRNNTCRLFAVTLTPEELDSLTEEQRQMWDKTSAYHRRVDQKDKRLQEINDLVQQLPPDRRTLG